MLYAAEHLQTFPYPKVLISFLTSNGDYAFKNFTILKRDRQRNKTRNETVSSNLQSIQNSHDGHISQIFNFGTVREKRQGREGKGKGRKTEGKEERRRRDERSSVHANHVTWATSNSN